MQDRAKRTREQVLDAAAAEFAVHGYTNTALGAVAARTGMTKGALYGHFDSKEALADAVVQQAVAEWELLRTSGTAPAPQASAQLRALTLGLAGRLHSSVRLRAGLRLTFDRPQPLGEAPDLVEDIRQQMVLLVERAQGEGNIPVAHTAERVAQLLLAVVCGVLYAASRSAVDARLTSMEGIWELLLALLCADGTG